MSSSIGTHDASLPVGFMGGGLTSAAIFVALTITESGLSRPAVTLSARCISAASAAFGKVVLK